MKRKVITTADGSKTIQILDWDEQYHSKHGAVQEAYHVFIKHGLDLFKNQELSILEIGFGTGLNAFITYIEADKRNLKIYYNGVEKFPVEENELHLLQYASTLDAKEQSAVFDEMHAVAWGALHEIAPTFKLQKRQIDFNDIENSEEFDLVYFDAFGARVQPELWTEEIFGRMFKALKKNGVLVTYAAKGSVRRAMQSVGFTVEKLPGPPGKREMLRAVKLQPNL